jgi:aminodeoxychorismate synthase component I
VREIETSADNLIRSLLGSGRPVSILDSCGVGHKGSHRLIAGIDPIEQLSVQSDAQEAIDLLEEVVRGDRAAVFTLSYDLGRSLQNVATRHPLSAEPFLHLASFEGLVVHDYRTGKTEVVGADVADWDLSDFGSDVSFSEARSVRSNISRSQYLNDVESIKEEIRSGNTYQTNMTRRINVPLRDDISPPTVFRRLRTTHPAPFSAFIERPDSTVISASPERFFKIEDGFISASPIKGTRPRGVNAAEDDRVRKELLSSEKDRAENTMIVDLLRNDLGRVCEFGSVEVESLCEIEELPSLFHLVSTIKGRLREDASFGDILRALFPCGSITGAPKISTMKIIDAIEPAPRGLSMGAIGCYIPASFGLGESIDLSVAIRTMVVRDGTATFNVGGGIVIDSDPEKEWDETVVKSKALLNSLGIEV